jgi:hypothetical protein
VVPPVDPGDRDWNRMDMEAEEFKTAEEEIAKMLEEVADYA